MNHPRLAGCLLVCFLVTTATAQVSLDSLWPNDNGRRWDYSIEIDSELPFEEVQTTISGFLAFEGTVTTPGGQAQALFGDHPDPVVGKGAAPTGLNGLLRAIWQGRPDLRKDLEALNSGKSRSYFWPLFLHPGSFMKHPDRLEMWQEEWDHPTWTYLVAPVEVGTGFMHHLIPELADDIFLYGTVTDIDATVTTPAGTFGGAVRVDYHIDMGISTITDENGNLIATFHGEHDGYVHFVPDVGPVQEHEVYIPMIWVDCSPNPCPQWLLDSVGLSRTISMELLSEPTSTESASWGQVKARYR